MEKSFLLEEGKKKIKKKIFEFENFVWEIFFSSSSCSITSLIVEISTMEVSMREWSERAKALDCIHQCLLIDTEEEEFSEEEENSFFTSELALFSSLQNESFDSIMKQTKKEEEKIVFYQLARVHFFCPKSSVDFFDSFKILNFHLNW